MKFHFAWSPWSDTTQRLLELRRNAYFPDDYGKARRHSWNRTYRRWKLKKDFHHAAFLRFVGGNFARGSDMSCTQQTEELPL